MLSVMKLLTTLKAPIPTPTYKKKEDPRLEMEVITTLEILSIPSLVIKNIFKLESILVHLFLSFL